MRNRGSFSLEFKRQGVEELVSGESRPARICRRYNISPSLLCRWRRQCSRGRFKTNPLKKQLFNDRIEKLERLVGRLTLENGFLKKGLQHSLTQRYRICLRERRLTAFGGYNRSLSESGGNGQFDEVFTKLVNLPIFLFRWPSD